MTEQIQWLNDIDHGPWAALGAARRSGLPVPEGFLVTAKTPEHDIRESYERLKSVEHTHYVAVRGPAKIEIDVIGTDQLIYALRRQWSESPNAEVLVQSMINAMWCGTATWEGKNLRIRASEGLRSLDTDMYLFNLSSGKCTRRTLYQRPRKMFRGVDGRTRTMEIIGERRPLETKYIQAIVELAKTAAADITWVLDDRRVWLISYAMVTSFAR